MEEKNDFLTKDKLLGAHKSLVSLRGLKFLLGILLFVDLLFINIKVFSNNNNAGVLPIFESSTDKELGQEAVVDTRETLDYCPDACTAKINSIVSSTAAKETQVIQNSVSGTSVKEFYIPLGSGQAASTTMSNVSGMQAYVDGSAYGRIKQATFEVSMYVPTGNEIVNVQLYNTTTSQPVWNSTVSYTGSAPQLLVSSPITLAPGNNLYQVQIQTQLNFPAIITQANIHIITY